MGKHSNCAWKNDSCVGPYSKYHVQIWPNTASQMNTDPYESESAVLCARFPNPRPSAYCRPHVNELDLLCVLRMVLEDAYDGVYQLAHNPELALAFCGTIFSIAFFNFAGVSVTKELSATTRFRNIFLTYFIGFYIQNQIQYGTVPHNHSSDSDPTLFFYWAKSFDPWSRNMNTDADPSTDSWASLINVFNSWCSYGKNRPLVLRRSGYYCCRYFVDPVPHWFWSSGYGSALGMWIRICDLKRPTKMKKVRENGPVTKRFRSGTWSNPREFQAS